MFITTRRGRHCPPFLRQLKSLAPQKGRDGKARPTVSLLLLHTASSGGSGNREERSPPQAGRSSSEQVGAITVMVSPAREVRNVPTVT